MDYTEPFSSSDPKLIISFCIEWNVSVWLFSAGVKIISILVWLCLLCSFLSIPPIISVDVCTIYSNVIGVFAPWIKGMVVKGTGCVCLDLICVCLCIFWPIKLALRAGNEKEEGETADTVGCCSLRVEHITLHEQLEGSECVVEFDFLGKDSIRYYNKVPVIKKVKEQKNAQIDTSTPRSICSPFNFWVVCLENSSLEITFLCFYLTLHPTLSVHCHMKPVSELFVAIQNQCISLQ